MAMLKSLSTGSMTVDVTQQGDDGDYIGHYPKLVDFEAKFRVPKESQSLKDQISKMVRKRCKNCDVRTVVEGYFPIVQTIRTYKIKEYLPNDIIAGITAGVMMIPQGMAFAALSTLPHIVGLYISLFASITYFFLGTGRQLSWGCIAILSLMMANILDRYDNSQVGLDFIKSLEKSHNVMDTADVLNGNGTTNGTLHSPNLQDPITARRMEVASGVSVIVGLVLIVASRLGLSRLTAIMSNSLITGFTVGISFHVAVSQLKGIFGLSIPRYKGIGQLIKTFIEILKNLPDTNVAALIISLVCMLIIYLVKKFINERYKKKMRIPIPIELFVVIAVTLTSYYVGFHDKYDVGIVKEVPTGVPEPKFPDISLVASYIGDALVIIVVSYAQSMAMAKTMSLKHNYIIDANQEMLANGACSIVCGFFSGYICGASVSRTVVQDGAGGKTQVASLFAAILVLLVIMVIGPYFYDLPKCVLSAIIVINLRTMFLKILLIPGEWRKSRYDCAVWVFACLATIILNADIGLLASVIFSLFLVVFRSMIKPVEEVGQIETSASTIQLRSVSNYTTTHTLHSVHLIRARTPLYFFNADTFTAAVFEKVQVDPVKIKALRKEKEDVHSKGELPRTNSNGATHFEKSETSHLIDLKVLVIDVSEVAFIDMMGVQALEFVIKEYSSIGIEVLIVSIPENIFDILQSSGFWKKQADRLFINVEAALASIAMTVENQQVNESTKI